MSDRVFRLSWKAGDWQQLYLDGDLLYAGHSIPEWVWVHLLKRIGVDVVTKGDLPDEDGLLCHFNNWKLVDYPGGDLTGLDVDSFRQGD